MTSYNRIEPWPMHNGREQMETMLKSSAHLIAMHKDPKQLITFVLSEAVFRACGQVMFADSFQPKHAVVWLGHDVLAKQLAARN